MKRGIDLVELAKELDRQLKNKRDFIVDTRNLGMGIENGNIHLDILKSTEPRREIERFSLNEIAHGQIAERLGIPMKYYNRMRTELPELLATNVNAWFQKEPCRRMVRTLDGRTRAFLSDRYRRIDNYEVAEAVLPVIAEMKDARVESCNLTESRMYIKVVNPRIETEVVPGDVVQAGVVISNSEVGMGAVSVYPLVFRLVCANGAIVNDVGKKWWHVGRTYGDEGEIYELYRDETLMADDRAFLMKVQDIVRVAVDRAKFATIVNRMREATEAKIEGNPEKVVELTAKKYRLNEDEKRGVLRHLIDGGDLSLYGLANSITRTSQQVENYDRATELEALGWQVMTISRGEWKELNA